MDDFGPNWGRGPTLTEHLAAGFVTAWVLGSLAYLVYAVATR